MLVWILLAILVHTTNSSCESTFYTADTACNSTSDTVVSCSLIQANIDPLCANLLTGWDIVNGPSCSIKGEKYGCMYSSSLDTTTTILCCNDGITPSPYSTLSRSPLSSRTSATTRSITTSVSVTSKVSKSPSVSSSPSPSFNSRSPGISRTSTSSSIVTPTLLLGRTVNMCTSTNITLPIIGSYVNIITNRLIIY